MSTPPPLTPFPPTPPPPLLRDQRVVDRQHLQLLCIFHFVVAGMAVLGMAFLFLHYMMFRTFFMNPQFWQNAQHPQQAPPFNPQELFNVLVWFYILFGFILLLAAVGNIISGLFLRKHKNRMFSIVIAGLDCLQVPFGTVLGVFTIIVLLRPSVIELYEHSDP